MSLNVTLRDLLEAGVHFGHQTTRWNPKMKRYIFEQRNKIHIIDLQKTMELLVQTFDFVKGLAARGQKILLVGTKKQAKEAIKEAATRCGMYYVNERWLGGLLTNFVTMRKSAAHYKHIQSIIDDGSIDKMPGKEASSLRREWTKLHRNLEGIKDMEALPAAVFIVDPKREAIAVNEARKMGIPVVAIADTNCDPDLLDYPIPGNDDALRTIKLFAGVIADAVLEGKKHIVVAPVIPAPAKEVVGPAATGAPAESAVAAATKARKAAPRKAEQKGKVPAVAPKEVARPKKKEAEKKTEPKAPSAVGKQE